jgi:hypothetical protein
MFVKERPKTKFSKFSGSGDKILKDLVKMGPKGLKDNEGKLASILDNLSRNGSKIDPKVVNPEPEKNIHVHIKRVARIEIKPNDKYQIVDGGLNFNVDKTKFIFAFFMASYRLDVAGLMAMKLNFSGRDIPESRQVLGNTKHGSLSGAFAEVYYPDGKAINLNLFFKTKVEGKVEDEGEHNYTIGAISMPVGAVFKHINSQPLTFKKSINKIWKEVENFELSVNFKDKNDYYFIIFYNFSLRLENKFSFGTRLTVDTKPILVNKLY